MTETLNAVYTTNTGPSYGTLWGGSNTITLGTLAGVGPVAEQLWREQMAKIQRTGNLTGVHTGGQNIMARLIRYTVVDPDKILCDKAEGRSILLSGTIMVNGTDDKGLLMDLSAQVALLLPSHNTARESVSYDDDEGREKHLKPIRLGQLDVVLEVLKQYQ